MQRIAQPKENTNSGRGRYDSFINDQLPNNKDVMSRRNGNLNQEGAHALTPGISKSQERFQSLPPSK